jgi:hypothetical protein
MKLGGTGLGGILRAAARAEQRRTGRNACATGTQKNDTGVFLVWDLIVVAHAR